MNLVHREANLEYKEDWEKVLRMDIPSSVKSNGSLHLHLFLTTTKLKSTVSFNFSNKLLIYYFKLSHLIESFIFF